MSIFLLLLAEDGEGRSRACMEQEAAGAPDSAGSPDLLQPRKDTGEKLTDHKALPVLVAICQNLHNGYLAVLFKYGDVQL